MKKVKPEVLFASSTLKVRVKYKFNDNGYVGTKDLYVYVPSMYTDYTPERYAVNARIERIIARKAARELAVPNDSRWTFWSATIVE